MGGGGEGEGECCMTRYSSSFELFLSSSSIKDSKSESSPLFSSPELSPSVSIASSSIKGF